MTKDRYEENFYQVSSDQQTENIFSLSLLINHEVRS